MKAERTKRRRGLAAALMAALFCACVPKATGPAPAPAAASDSSRTTPPPTAIASSPPVVPATIETLARVATQRELPLFGRFPALKSGLHRLPLDPLFSPITPIDSLAAELSLAGLFVKRDDRLGDPFGGSKVRKLEFLLGEAIALRKSTVVTFGGLASNHALATSLYAHVHGLHAKILLLPELPTPRARANLLAIQSLGAELHLTNNARIDALVRQPPRPDDPDAPYIIEPGGTSPLGCVGYVNAAFELQAQIEAGELRRPDVVYVAAGTSGTSVGLMVGLAAAGLRIPVRAVRVSSTRYVHPGRMRKLFDQTVALLRGIDPSFPALSFDDASFDLVQGQAGAGYSLPTRAGADAARRVESASGIRLDPTYTAKAMAAVIEQAPEWKGRTVLFWDTYDPRMVPATVGLGQLPAEFRGWFPTAQ